MDYISVKTFIEEFRNRVGDTTRDIPVSHILTSIRHALNYLARERGLHRLFEYEDTFDLLRIKPDGDYANEWVLNGGKQKNLGYIINIASLKILDNSGIPCVTNMQHLPYRWFSKEYPLAKLNHPGTPSAFTLRTTQGQTRIVFNCPISKPYAIEMLYSAAHPRITSEKDDILIPYLFIDLLVELVAAFYYKEAADFNFSRSQYEDIDYMTSQIREMLYQQQEGLDPRRIRRSY